MGWQHEILGRDCQPIQVLGLSGGQWRDIKEVDKRYKEEILAERNKIMLKRLELQDLIRNTKASEEEIRRKATELGEARSVLQRKMIDYQIHIRRILTPDQRRRWCTMIGRPFLGVEPWGGSW